MQPAATVAPRNRVDGTCLISNSKSRRWQLRAEQVAQQQLTRWQEHAPPPCSISTGCSRHASLSRRLHLRDWQTRVAQLSRWQLQAGHLAQQQLTRWQDHMPPPRSISADCSSRAALSRRLHLTDQELRVEQLPQWQLQADQLAQQQLTRCKSTCLHHAL